MHAVNNVKLGNPIYDLEKKNTAPEMASFNCVHCSKTVSRRMHAVKATMGTFNNYNYNVDEPSGLVDEPSTPITIYIKLDETAV